jgi:hypothetical protein
MKIIKKNPLVNKKKLVNILTTAMVLLSGIVYGEDAPTPESTLSTTGQVIRYLKEKFKASYHGEYYFARRLPFFEDVANDDQKRIQDLHILHNPTIIYNPNNKWQLLATAEFKYTDRPNYVLYPNTFYRSLFTLTRKNIFTEKENGFKLDAGIGRRQFNTGIAAIAVYGNDRAFATISKTFYKNSGSVFFQYIYNDYKHPSSTMWKHAMEILPTFTFQITEKFSWVINDDLVINLPNDEHTARKYYITHDFNIGYFAYQWNDKLATYYQLKYGHLRYDFTRDYRSDLDALDNYVGVSYSFNKNTSLTAELGSEVLRAGDNEKFISKKFKYPELTLYVDISL